VAQEDCQAQNAGIPSKCDSAPPAALSQSGLDLSSAG
jgi:hypothetical protein